MSDKSVHEKINIPLPASAMTGGLSLDDKTKYYVDRNTIVMLGEHSESL